MRNVRGSLQSRICSPSSSSMCVISAGENMLCRIVLCGWMFISTRSPINNQLSGQCSIGKIERSAIGMFYMSILVDASCGTESTSVWHQVSAWCAGEIYSDVFILHYITF